MKPNRIILFLFLLCAVIAPNRAYANPRRLTIILNVYDHYLLANEDSSSSTRPWILAFRIARIDTHLVSIVPSSIPAADGQCKLLGNDDGKHSDVLCALKFSEGELIRILRSEDDFYRTFLGTDGNAIAFNIHGQTHSITEEALGVVPAIPEMAVNSAEVRQQLPRVRFSESPIVVSCTPETVATTENNRRVVRRRCQLKWKSCSNSPDSLCSTFGFEKIIENYTDSNTRLYVSLAGLGSNVRPNSGDGFSVSLEPIEKETPPPLPGIKDFCLPTLAASRAERFEVLLGEQPYPSPFDLVLRASDGTGGRSVNFSRLASYFRVERESGEDNGFEIEKIQSAYLLTVDSVNTRYLFTKPGGSSATRFTPKLCKGPTRWVYCSAGQIGEDQDTCTLRGNLLRQKCDAAVQYAACSYSSANFGGDSGSTPKIARTRPEQVMKRGSIHLELVDGDVIATICPPGSDRCFLRNITKKTTPTQHVPANAPLNIEDRLKDNPSELSELIDKSGATLLWLTDDCFKPESAKEVGCE